jgi:cell wall-associated NlpC family hydrolase
VSDRPCNRSEAPGLQRVIVRFAAVSVLSAVCLFPCAAIAAPALQSTDVSNAPANSRTHTVAAGDSLTSIAAAYSLSLDTLKAANPNLSADRLEVGQVLLILPGDGLIYSAKSGDNLKKIAESYSVKTDVVAQANKLDSADKLGAGQVLFIPANADARSGQSDADANADPRTYKVQPSDTLWTISQRFGVEPTTIMMDNDLKDPKAVIAGARLRILPSKGASVVLQSTESLADLATRYQIDLGALMDYNRLDSADAAKPGARIVIPQTNAQPAQPSDATASNGPSTSKGQLAAASLISSELIAPGGGDKGQLVASTAMKYVGSKYVFGGTTPSGFDCSGFAYFVQKSAGVDVGRTLWQQFNAGPRVAKSQLEVGDEVFFANTYMPGLSHAGIFIGQGKFVHANNERTGVVVSRLDDDYWAQRFVGAARIRG